MKKLYWKWLCAFNSNLKYETRVNSCQIIRTTLFALIASVAMLGAAIALAVVLVILPIAAFITDYLGYTHVFGADYPKESTALFAYQVWSQVGIFIDSLGIVLIAWHYGQKYISDIRYEKMRKKRAKEYAEWEANGFKEVEVEPRKPSFIATMFKAIHDKTCVYIETDQFKG